MKRAVTLIELIIVIVILGVVAGMGTQVIYLSYKEQVRTQLMAKMQGEAKGALYTMASALKMSIRESARFRQSLMSNAGKSAPSCDQGGCKYLYNFSSDLKQHQGGFHGFEVALFDRPYGQFATTINETACVNDLILRLNTWKDKFVAPTSPGDSGHYEKLIDPCFIDGALVDGTDKGNRIFRCFSIIMPNEQLPAINWPAGAQKQFNSCNHSLIAKRFMDPAFFVSQSLIYDEDEDDEDDEEEIITETLPPFAPGQDRFYADWFGLYFKGDQIANTSTFLERDVYPAHIVYYNNASNQFTDPADFRTPWSHWEVFFNIDDKNFAISNAYELVRGMQYFELVEPFSEYDDIDDLKPCTSDTCTLLMANLSYDAYINELGANIQDDIFILEDDDDDSAPIATFSKFYQPKTYHNKITDAPQEALKSHSASSKFENTPNLLRQKIFAYDPPAVLATGVSKLEISDSNGVRTVTICLQKPFITNSIFEGEDNIEICRSEVI